MSTRHTNDAVDPDAAEKGEEKSGVHLERLVPEAFRENGKEHQEVDPVSDENGDEVLDPSPQSHGRSLPSCRQGRSGRSG